MDEVDGSTSWLGGRSIDGGLDEIVIDGERTGIWLAGKRVLGSDPEAGVARVEGTEVTVVCLCQEHEIDDRYPDYLAWLEANEGGRALWRPIPDLSAPPIVEARALAATLNARLDDGSSLLIHCGAGLGRAPTVAIATLLARGHRLDTILRAVADSRPMAGPETGDQQELLEALAAGGGAPPDPVG